MTDERHVSLNLDGDKVVGTAPAQGVAASATEYAWLIEAGWSGTASVEYWCGCVVTGGGGIQHEWSFSHSRAIRFARKEDAKRIANILIDGEAYRIAEHAWDTETPLPSSPTQGVDKRLAAALHEASVYGIGATSDYNQRVILEAAKALAAQSPAETSGLSDAERRKS
ncbi:hypothetical protein ACVWZ4_007213 [Bradyrhizobium sp. USDA 4472]